RFIARRRPLLLQAAQLGQQLGFGLGVVRIRIDAFDRAHHHALGLVEVPHALGAQRRVDLVDRLALRNRGVRAGRLADVAVDAQLVYFQRHRGSMRRTAPPCRPRTLPRPGNAGGPGRTRAAVGALTAPAYFWMKMYSTPAGA